MPRLWAVIFAFNGLLFVPTYADSGVYSLAFGAIVGQEPEDEEAPSEKPEDTKAKPVATKSVKLPEEEEEEPAAAKSKPPSKPDKGTIAQEELLGREKQIAQDQKPELVADYVLLSMGFDGASGARPVKLLPNVLRLPFPAGAEYRLELLTKEGKPSAIVRVAGNKISAVKYYEQWMLELAARESGMEQRQLIRPNLVYDVSSADIARRAEKARAILTLSLAEHDSAVQRGLRQGTEWQDLRRPLAQALFNIQINQARQTAKERRFQHAAAAADELRKLRDLGTENELAIRGLFEHLFLEQAERDFETGAFDAARHGLAEFLVRYPLEKGERAIAIRRKLIETAQELVDRALQEKKPKLFDLAAAVWPQLPGLDQQRQRLQEAYPVLHVAYNNLPNNFSPLTARTPVDRHAVSLMFESLVRWRDEQPAGPHYASQLAARRPLPLAKGREFELPRCLWSDSKDDAIHLCTADDVRVTVQVMKAVHPFGFSAAWQQLVADVDTSTTDGDPFRVAIMLKRDHWQPLSLMDFHIIPRASFPGGGTVEELEKFSRRPVGTGPFQLADTNDPQTVRFVANPCYRKPGLPKIREIVFNQLDSIEAGEEFKKGQIQLIYGVRPEQVGQLRQSGKTVVTIPARNVHFLAPNYRNERLQNADLRLAIAHTINRTKILETIFRPGGAVRDHSPITGPFPTKSWAYNRDVSEFSPARAQVHMAQAKTTIGEGPIKLGLLFPAADPEAQKACTEIKNQLQEIGIELSTEAVDPDRLYDLVVVQHKFDLVYWRHDFEDETYSIWPLFDPADQGPGGSNFMGCSPDQDLHTLFGDLIQHKQFIKIRDAVHKIHEHVARRATVIPLWELDTYVAVGDTLMDYKLDSLTLFQDVETWRVTPR